MRKNVGDSLVFFYLKADTFCFNFFVKETCDNVGFQIDSFNVESRYRGTRKLWNWMTTLQKLLNVSDIVPKQRVFEVNDLITYLTEVYLHCVPCLLDYLKS